MVSTRGKQSTDKPSVFHDTVNGSLLDLNPKPRPRKRRRGSSNENEVSPHEKRHDGTAAEIQDITLAAQSARGRPRKVQSDNANSQGPAEDPSADAVADDNAAAQLASQLSQELCRTTQNGELSQSTATTQAMNAGYSSQAYDQLTITEASRLLPQETNLEMKLQSLPVLDNLANQILTIIARSSYQEVVNMAMKKDTEPGKNYETLRDLFSHAKKVYSPSQPFLQARELGFTEASHIDTIRKANMATFIISVLGSQDVGFYHLNEFFIDTFVAERQVLKKVHSELLLELKTQAYISAISNGERAREEILHDLFPADLEQRLMARRPDAKHVAPSEKEFITRMRMRRKSLLDESDTAEAVRKLPEKYVWTDFFKEISRYITKTHTATTDDKMNKKTPVVPESAPWLSLPGPTHYQTAPDLNQGDDIAGKAQRAAQYAMQDYGSNRTPVANGQPDSQPLQHPTLAPPQGPEIQFHFENKLHPNVPGPQLTSYYNPATGQHGSLYDHWGVPFNDPNYVPYPTQSAPTAVLYERARMAASHKSAPSTRKNGQPSQRHPWTLEEENALMAGLDRVKGPHWSQILAIFGQGGTISEILKDRGQVQLKDKARNLKLFFLKNNIEVPYYLQFVTGELKTRAPGAAAKAEARRNEISEEERARTEGILALAAGPQRGESSGDLVNEHGATTNDPTAPVQTNSHDNLDPTLSAIIQHNQNRTNFAPIPDMTSGRRPTPQPSTSQSTFGTSQFQAPGLGLSTNGTSPTNMARPGIPM